MGQFVRHEACDKCGSSDGRGVYDDGSKWCFPCQTFFHADGATEDRKAPEGETRFSRGTYQDIPRRGLRESICARYGYQVDGQGKDVRHIAPFRDSKRTLVAQKIRKPGKDFHVEGQGKDLPFFGQHLWSQGKSLVITEGEIDCLTVAQVLGDGKWPVVSLPQGAQSAPKAIKQHYEWLCGFEKIILCFDNDKAGQDALEECLPLLPPGKAYTMSLPEKDANETFLKHGPKPITEGYWQASRWRPDGIISGADISLDSLRKSLARGYNLRYPKLNELLGGIRKREFTMLTAGTGIGKSTLAREIAYGLHQDHGLTIGNIYLEESKEKTAQGYIAIHNDVPLGNLRKDPGALSEANWKASYDTIIRDRMHFYDHFGSLESDHLISKLRYLAVVLECDFIVLDHISLVISGQEGGSGDERKDIDKLMTAARTLIEETGVGIIGITHLRQPEGKPHEEGGRVTLSQLRGSGSLKHIPDSIIALERDQQSATSANECDIRVLKNREFGDLGVADRLKYHKETGRLLAMEREDDFPPLDV